jgi:simple sugar transport system permease protein
VAAVGETQDRRTVWVSRGWRAAFRLREASIAVVTIGLIVYFGVLNPVFLTPANARVISQFTAIVAILAAGEVMLLTCGEIDLSVGHIAAFAPFIMLFGLELGLPFLLALLLGVLAAGVVGLVNGAITVWLHVPSFITTLGTLFVLNGTTLIISGGFPKPAPREGQLVSIFGGGSMAIFWWALGLAILMHMVLKNTRWGVYTVATGGNPIGAREAGVPTSLIKVGNFVMAGMMAGFAGILNGLRLSSFDAQALGAETMFLGVASAVIGGTALGGGSGTVIGGFLGALFLGVLRDGFTIQGISSFTFFVILGAAILISMVVNVRIARLRTGMRR